MEDDTQERLRIINEKINNELPRFWEQARKNAEEDKTAYYKRKYGMTLDEINKNIPIFNGENGIIELDPNNWHHVQWFEDDKGVEEFIRLNEDEIKSYSSEQKINLKDSLDVLYKRYCNKQ